MTENTKPKPVNKVRFGPIEVSEWENTSKDGFTFPSFTLKRSYRDRDDQWCEQKISLNRDGLLRVAAAAQQAFAESYQIAEAEAEEIRENQEIGEDQAA